MSKAILEIEMPKSCSGCWFRNGDINSMFDCNLGIKHLSFNGIKTEKHKGQRHPQCPLKPIPTLDELRAEIIEGLNDWQNVSQYDDDASYDFVNNEDYMLFYFDMYLPEIKYFKKINQFENVDGIPLETAHKITTYFTRLE